MNGTVLSGFPPILQKFGPQLEAFHAALNLSNPLELAEHSVNLSDPCLFDVLFPAFNAPSVLSALNLTHRNLSEQTARNLTMGILIAEIAQKYHQRANLYLVHSLICICICAPLLLLQLTSLPVFLVHRNYRRNVCFRILFSNGITDCLQLGTKLVYAVLNLAANDISRFLRVFGGAIVIPAWYLVVLQHFLLALNRLIVILRARYLGSKYIPDEDLEALAFNIAHFCCWSFYLAMIGLFVSPFVGTLFYRPTSNFNFDNEKPYTQNFREVIWYFTAILPVLSFAIYILIVWTAKKSRRSIQQTDRVGAGTTAANSGGTTPLLNDYERRLLIQAIILYTLMSLLLLSWHIFKSCDVNGVCHGTIVWIVPVHMSYDAHAFFVEVPWLLYCGLNPILFIVMNKEFRNRYFGMYGWKPTSQVSQLFNSTLSTLLPCTSVDKGTGGGNQVSGKKPGAAVSHDPVGRRQKMEEEGEREVNKRKMTK